MKKVFLIGIVICSFFTAIAQENNAKKIKVYQTWIKLNNNSQKVKGILYEIGDSSLSVAGMYNFSDVHEYSFKDIDLMKVRREKSIKRGAINGMIIGAGTGVIIASSLGEGYELFGGIFSTYFGIVYGSLGAAVGTWVGSIKDRFPIRNSFENLEKYRGTLQGYSYQREKITATPPFEHRGSFEFSGGVSFAAGEFASKIPVNNYQGMEMVGFSSKTTFGYRFTKGLAVSFAVRTNQYNVKGNSEVPMYWNLDAFTFGPVISLPLVNKLRFDLTPAVGFASAYMLLGDREVYTGEGIAMNITGSLVYRLSKRVNATLSAGYLSSDQEYDLGGNGQARDMDIELGVAYKFGKRSL